MKALCWHGPKDVRVDTVSDPEILNPHDVIIKVQASAICGSDLHIYHGFVMFMHKGDILGHEFAGEVVEIGGAVTNLKKGDRVVVPFTISCGKCRFCKEKLWSLCDNTNPNGAMLAKATGYPSAALYGYSHLYGGMPGGQAEYVRVPFADVGCLKIPDGLSYEEVLFLSDIFPTGYMAAEQCGIRSGDTVAVWGCGPVGLFAIKSALMLGAGKVIAIDRFPERLSLASLAGAEIFNYTSDESVREYIGASTGGLGPDSCIDAVGMEAHADTIDGVFDDVMQKVKVETDRSHALREAIFCCKKGGTISIPGVYTGLIDKFPIGIAFAKALTFKMGQTHVPNYMKLLLDKITNKEIDPTFLISHRMRLEDAPSGYAIFSAKQDNCTKIVLHPHGEAHKRSA